MVLLYHAESIYSSEAQLTRHGGIIIFFLLNKLVYSYGFLFTVFVFEFTSDFLLNMWYLYLVGKGIFCYTNRK